MQHTHPSRALILCAGAYRPREKMHRPQTRRRRDQADDSLDKLRQLRSNLGRARELLDTLARREQRKAHVLVRLDAVGSGYRAVLSYPAGGFRISPVSAVTSSQSSSKP